MKRPVEYLARGFIRSRHFRVNRTWWGILLFLIASFTRSVGDGDYRDCVFSEEFLQDLRVGIAGSLPKKSTCSCSKTRCPPLRSNFLIISSLADSNRTSPVERPTCDSFECFLYSLKTRFPALQNRPCHRLPSSRRRVRRVCDANMVPKRSKIIPLIIRDSF